MDARSELADAVAAAFPPAILGFSAFSWPLRTAG